MIRPTGYVRRTAGRRTAGRGGLMLALLLSASGLGVASAAMAAEAESASTAEAVAGVVSAAGTAAASAARDADILVLGVREQRVSKGATYLPLSITETPQAVSIVDREFLDRFALDDVNQALNLVTGINVEEVETDRTYYISRGFDIKAMQVDGIGLPFNWNVVGALDTAVYDRIEVIRGANGLLTGTGNPSGTINYIRKRPTNDTRATAEFTVGSWGKMRAEGDVSIPLTSSGTWAARIVAARQVADSHLDHYSNERTIFQGIVEGQIGERTIVTVGYTQQDNNSDGALWGALPLLYSDGTQAEFDRSTSTAMDWTRWNTNNKTAFGEIVHSFARDWQAKLVVTYNDYFEDSELFYIYGAPGLDKETGLGLYGWPSKYDSFSERLLVEGTVQGTYDLFGRRHDLVFGVNYADADNGYLDYPAPADDPGWGAMPPFPGWTGFEIPRPNFGASFTASDWTDEVKRLFAVTRLNLADGLFVIAGANAIDVKSRGYSFDESMDADEDKVSPYAGFTYEVVPSINLYASYSDIFEPQGELSVDGGRLGAAKGKSYEAGVKGEFLNQRLFASLSLFRATQSNLAEAAGFDPNTGQALYRGTSVRSRGFEAEVSGRVSDDLFVLAGFTWLDMDNQDGTAGRTFVPRKTANLAVRYSPPVLEGLEVGGTVKWQSDTYLDNGIGIIRQGDYATVGLFAHYAVTDHMALAVNLNNLTDAKYLTSLYWDQAFYGAPRNVSASLRFTF